MPLQSKLSNFKLRQREKTYVVDTFTVQLEKIETYSTLISNLKNALCLSRERQQFLDLASSISAVMEHQQCLRQTSLSLATVLHSVRRVESSSVHDDEAGM